MKVLQVIASTDRRGAEVHAVQLGERLAERGADVRTLAVSARPGGLPVDALGGRGPRELGRLRSAMAAVDVTIAHGSATLAACAAAGAGPGRPFVYRQISDPVRWAATGLRRARVVAYYRSPARVVSLSPVTAEILRRRFLVRGDRISVIPNAVDDRRFPQADAEARAVARRRLTADTRPVVAYVGSLTEEKAVADLVEAVDPGWHLVVAGDGPLRGALERQAAGRSLAATFLGVVAEPWDVHAAADVVVLPSRSEQQPGVLVEAALVGTPVVATDVGAVSEIVEHGRTGTLVAPGDPGGLRAAIAGVLEDPEQAATLAGTARDRAERQQTIGAVVERWEAVLEAAARR